VSGADLAVLLADEAATVAAGARLARVLASTPEAERGPLIVTLSGPLGAGKTTFVRGALRELGVTGAIRSPSYTLVEEYTAGGWDVLHLDLYRITGSGELAELGIRDRHQGAAVFLVEWPERAPQSLAPDLALDFTFRPDGHHLRGQARTSQGQRLVAALAA
jgi:tRNA threonylcarbamoyladenosine biosynthesis protein TsaE